MRVLRLAVLAAAIGTLTCVAFAGTAGAGAQMSGAPLTINKVVTGPVPAGTTFTVTVTCDKGIIADSPDPNVATVTFNAAGVPTSDNVIQFNPQGTCTVTETAKGGAATTSFVCSGVVDATADVILIPNPCGAVTTTDVTILVSSLFQSATVTVTNTFVAPPVAPRPSTRLCSRRPRSSCVLPSPAEIASPACRRALHSLIGRLAPAGRPIRSPAERGAV